jgi:hypothetical protein
VRVTAVEQETATATFTLHVVDLPQITGLSVSQAPAGETITVQGMNFLPDGTQNVVLFSGIRGAVASGGSTELRVVVPPCLPSRTVDVTVLLGSVASASVPLSVTDGGQPTLLSPGEVLDVADPSGVGCLRLPGEDDQVYLAVTYSAGTVGAAKHAASFHGLSSAPPGLAAVRSTAGPPDPRALAAGVQEAWGQKLRLREAELATASRRLPAGLHVQAPAVRQVPTVGHERTFQVLNAQGSFDEVRAVARYVGEQAVLYVDEAAPSGGFNTADLEAFSETFDEMIYPTVTGAFGTPSDLDGNDRVVILFTAAVNRLSPRGSDGFVGGFFYGLDLLVDSENSNEGEIFYALVPDPTGEVADPHPKTQVLEVTPAILAHEFQHMVHFNQRVLVGGAGATEALWLSEGLAQMAEELVARAYEEVASPTAEDFRSGNLARARRYLSDPPAVSLIVTAGQGSLAERGAGWLHVLYLTERYGEAILGRLTASARRGVDNVVFETGASWEAVLADWWAALYLDGRGDYAPELGFGSFGLRELLTRGGVGEDLEPPLLGLADFREDLSFWSSSANHYILRPRGGSEVIRLGGEGGGTASAEAALGLRIVRLF